MNVLDPKWIHLRKQSTTYFYLNTSLLIHLLSKPSRDSALCPNASQPSDHLRIWAILDLIDDKDTNNQNDQQNSDDILC